MSSPGPQHRRALPVLAGMLKQRQEPLSIRGGGEALGVFAEGEGVQGDCYCTEAAPGPVCDCASCSGSSLSRSVRCQHGVVTQQ